MCPFVYRDQLFILLLFAKRNCSHIQVYIAIIFNPVDQSGEILLLASKNKSFAVLFQRTFGAG